MKPTNAEIVVVGNELLNGTTLDTNSHWLSLELTKIGVVVSRKTTIEDDFNVISNTFRVSLERKPDWIFSIGGLGPTYDDKTLQGLALATNRKIQKNELAASFLTESYQRRAKLLRSKFRRPSRASLKMAQIPDGSIPLRNAAGSAPGVLSETDLTKIVSLPGVPREMKAIFLQEVRPLILKELKPYFRKEIWLEIIGVGESNLAPYLTAFSKKFSPTLYIKSHPIGFRKGKSLLQVQLIGKEDDKSGRDAKLKLRAASALLEKTVTGLGGLSKVERSIR